MGNCAGCCMLSNSDNSCGICGFTVPKRRRDSFDFSFLVDENSARDCSKQSIFSHLFSKRTRNSKKPKKPVLELVDDILNPQVTYYSRLRESQCLPSSGSCTSRDIPLQCLDARALLARTAESTPASSLDLEWEHETLPVSLINDASGSSCWENCRGTWQNGCEFKGRLTRQWERTALAEEFGDEHHSEASPQNSVPPKGSDSEWSRVSSANSLEWDNVQNSLHASPPASEIDTDTQMLLCEIERLTSQTLSETGLDLDSNC